jgi:hypothetical protein
MHIGAGPQISLKIRITDWIDPDKFMASIYHRR